MKENKQVFYYPEDADISDVHFEDFVGKQPRSGVDEGTSWTTYFHKFQFKFKNYTVK